MTTVNSNPTGIKKVTKKTIKKLQKEFQEAYELEQKIHQENEERQGLIKDYIFQMMVDNHFNFAQYSVTKGACIAFITYAKVLSQFSNKDIEISSSEMDKMEKCFKELIESKIIQNSSNKSTPTVYTENKPKNAKVNTSVTSNVPKENLNISQKTIQNPTSQTATPQNSIPQKSTQQNSVQQNSIQQTSQNLTQQNYNFNRNMSMPNSINEIGTTTENRNVENSTARAENLAQNKVTNLSVNNNLQDEIEKEEKINSEFRNITTQF